METISTTNVGDVESSPKADWSKISEHYPELAKLIENHLTQLELAELDASKPVAAAGAATVEEARRRRIDPFAK